MPAFGSPLRLSTSLALSAVAVLGIALGGCDYTKPTVEAVALGNGVSPLILTTFQAASLVIGQPDFVSGTVNNGGIGAQSLNRPRGHATFSNGMLYLADYLNNRVLGYNGVPTSNFAAASIVLGEPDFVSSGGGTTANLFSLPYSLTPAGNALVLTDIGNSRVLIWNSAPTSTNVAANHVLGQADFVSTSFPSCTQAGFFQPQGVSSAGGKLVLSDPSGHRVLIWNTFPTTDGQAADLVLGQTSFTSCLPNISGVSIPTAGSLNLPREVWTDGTRVIVADENNNRVLIWNTFPTVNGQAADVVLGQAGFTSFGSATTQTGMNNPIAIASNGLQLVVGDSANARMLVYNSIPTTSGAPADVVLGQPNFTTSGAGGPSATNDTGPWGAFIVGKQLIATDNGNSRILIYQGQ